VPDIFAAQGPERLTDKTKKKKKQHEGNHQINNS
jgi:hypothetical protein